jgi:threonine aldolase
MRSSQRVVDLRSDTVTLPTEAMRGVMAEVPLGDDGRGEDPTVNRLEATTAELLGKEAALLLSSGTQANLTALLSLTRPGQEIILEAEAHIFWYEVGGLARIAGLTARTLPGRYGVLDPEQVRAAIRPPNIHYPETALVCIENTHNRAGGTVWSLDQIRAVADVAREHGLPVYMDGARMFNAAVALGVAPREVVRDVDAVGFCLSKGLSCPVGSLLVGPGDLIDRARKVRKLLGGGLRQAGWIAAPGIIALQTMIDRLAEDHRLARELGERLTEIEGVRVDLARVQTNMVQLDVSPLGPEVGPARFARTLDERGVRALPYGKHVIRMVTHYGISRADIDFALEAVAEVARDFRSVATAR